MWELLEEVQSAAPRDVLEVTYRSTEHSIKRLKRRVIYKLLEEA